jgi:hypothetical protein
MDVVVSEKLDGENTNLYQDYFHARSLDSRHHPSRSWVKNLWQQIKHEIPDGWRICGENMYAKHSIQYNALPSYFLVFGIYDEANVCLSWADTVELCRALDLYTAPVLYIGPWDEEAIKACMKGESLLGGEQEGYVVRNAKAFPYDAFYWNAAKFVRPKHVQTSEFWMNQPIVKNILAE